MREIGIILEDSQERLTVRCLVFDTESEEQLLEKGYSVLELARRVAARVWGYRVHGIHHTWIVNRNSVYKLQVDALVRQEKFEPELLGELVVENFYQPITTSFTWQILPLRYLLSEEDWENSRRVVNA